MFENLTAEQAREKAFFARNTQILIPYRYIKKKIDVESESGGMFLINPLKDFPSVLIKSVSDSVYEKLREEGFTVEIVPYQGGVEDDFDSYTTVYVRWEPIS